ncbi:MAG: winged helix-turn-helix domain-containing protein [Trebonia sp.]
MPSDRNLARAGRATPGPEQAGRRELSDPRTMRALTHPVRLALLQALELEGPLTATQAGELIGEPPNTCSFHFRQLAKYGFVEEAGPAPGRSRPWRLATYRMHFTDLHEDPDAAVAARGLDRMLRERYFERLEAFYASRSGYPLAWQEATGGSQALLHVTPEELKAIDEQIMAVLDPYRDRSADLAKRPANSLPIEVLLFAYPVRPPAK